MSEISREQIEQYSDLYRRLCYSPLCSVDEFKSNVDEIKLLLTNPDNGNLFINYDKSRRHPLLCEFGHQYSNNYVIKNMFSKLEYLLRQVWKLLMKNKDTYGFDWYMRLHYWSPAEYWFGRPIIERTIDFGEYTAEIDRLHEEYF